jgi:hypothetical protein
LDNFIYFSLIISFLAPSRIYACIVSKLLNCASLNASICYLLVISSEWSLFYFRVLFRLFIYVLSKLIYFYFYSNIFFVFFICYWIFDFIFIANPFVFLNYSLSLDLVWRSYNLSRLVLLNKSYWLWGEFFYFIFGVLGVFPFWK